MRILKSKSNDGKELTITLPEKFDFQLHAEFREAYENKEIKKFVLDMNKTQYMDSSALGMLLQLKEHIDHQNGDISIKNANNNIKQIMQIAHFDKLFTMA
jgi:HptB-dependent secretion and biofilm anti anti-sigma factor